MANQQRRQIMLFLWCALLDCATACEHREMNGRSSMLTMPPRHGLDDAPLAARVGRPSCSPNDLRLAGFTCFPSERSMPGLLACVGVCETDDDTCRGHARPDVCDAQWEHCTESCRGRYPGCAPDAVPLDNLCARPPSAPLPQPCVEQHVATDEYEGRRALRRGR